MEISISQPYKKYARAYISLVYLPFGFKYFAITSMSRRSMNWDTSFISFAIGLRQYTEGTRHGKKYALNLTSSALSVPSSRSSFLLQFQSMSNYLVLGYDMLYWLHLRWVGLACLNYWVLKHLQRALLGCKVPFIRQQGHLTHLLEIRVSAQNIWVQKVYHAPEFFQLILYFQNFVIVQWV